MKQVKLVNSKVWLVLEHAWEDSLGKWHDAVAHDLFVNENEALGKQEKLESQAEHGYVTVRGISVRGKQREFRDLIAQLSGGW